MLWILILLNVLLVLSIIYVSSMIVDKVRSNNEKGEEPPRH